MTTTKVRRHRETLDSKALRLIAGNRVYVQVVDAGYVRALVNGDADSTYTVTRDRGDWFCTCPCRRACSHERAVALVTEVAP
jgi:uncharacterized Zn finger protein